MSEESTPQQAQPEEPPYTRIPMLRVKIRSLAEEAKIIRHEELRHPKQRAELHRHRTFDVREEARAAHIAYGFLRGRTYHQIEKSCKSSPNWDRVQKLVEKYGVARWDDKGAFNRQCLEFGYFVGQAIKLVELHKKYFVAKGLLVADERAASRAFQEGRGTEDLEDMVHEVTKRTSEHRRYLGDLKLLAALHEAQVEDQLTTTGPLATTSPEPSDATSSQASIL